MLKLFNFFFNQSKQAWRHHSKLYEINALLNDIYFRICHVTLSNKMAAHWPKQLESYWRYVVLIDWMKFKNCISKFTKI